MPETPIGPGRRARRRRRSEDGQSLIEFTFAAPVLIMLLLGMAEFGHGLNAYLTVVAAARDSARLGAQFGVTDSVGPALMRNVVYDETARLSNPITAADGDCTDGKGVCIESCVSNSSCTGSPVDRTLKVEVCYEHPLIIGIPFIEQGPISMCSSTDIRMARQ
jgi:hypothetical protein